MEVGILERFDPQESVREESRSSSINDGLCVEDIATGDNRLQCRSCEGDRAVRAAFSKALEGQEVSQVVAARKENPRTRGHPVWWDCLPEIALVCKDSCGTWGGRDPHESPPFLGKKISFAL
jgi:hypothetical protein